MCKWHRIKYKESVKESFAHKFGRMWCDKVQKRMALCFRTTFTARSCWTIFNWKVEIHYLTNHFQRLYSRNVQYFKIGWSSNAWRLQRNECWFGRTCGNSTWYSKWRSRRYDDNGIGEMFIGRAFTENIQITTVLT